MRGGETGDHNQHAFVTVSQERGGEEGRVMGTVEGRSSPSVCVCVVCLWQVLLSVCGRFCSWFRL